jgi:hypothetical protein
MCSLALLACRPTLDSGEDDAAGEDDPPGDGDGDPPGDGDGDPSGDGNMKAICDISQFPQVSPEWLALNGSVIESGVPIVSALEVTEEAIFSAGWEDASSPEPPGFIERRNLDGTLVWEVGLPKVRNMALHWDGQHIYASYGKGVRRWAADGGTDDWIVNGEFIPDMAVDAESVAVIENYSIREGHHDDLNVAYGAYTKAIPPGARDGGIFGISGRTEFAEVVAPSPWGGWLAAGSFGDISDDGHAFIAGFDGVDLDVTLSFSGRAAVVGMTAHDDILIVLGRNTGRGVVWLSTISRDGEELSRHEQQLCAGVRSSLSSIVARENHIWALGSVWTSQDRTSPLLVQFAYDGQIERTWAFMIDADYYQITALEAVQDTIYIGGYLRRGAEFRRTIGRFLP